MSDNIDLYTDFNGYNAYPIKEAEKIIRKRFSVRMGGLIEKIQGCKEKAKEMHRLKELSEVEKVLKRMERMKKEISERDHIFVAPYLPFSSQKISAPLPYRQKR